MMTLTDILQQPDGFTPPGLKVRVVRVFDQKSGEGEKGPWSFQDVEVEDASGKGRLKLKNCEPLSPDRQGKELILTANQSKQHGLTGLKVAHEEYQGKTFDKLVVTGSAQWTWEGNGHKPEAQPEKPAYTAVAHPPIERPEPHSFKDHFLALAEVTNQVAEKLGIVSDEARQACFATLCIDAQRRGIVLDASEESKKRRAFINRIVDLWAAEDELRGKVLRQLDEPSREQLINMPLKDLEALGIKIRGRVDALREEAA